MKHISSFDAFLTDVVNLNSTRIDQLDDSYEAIKNFIRGSTFKPRIASFYEHGSWAHKTIIRPVHGKAFDADVIVFVKPVEGWSAADYMDDLERIFRSSPVYEDKIRVFSHCITIEYAGERKMDITPCVVNRTGDNVFEVCNGALDSFEPTEPGKYTRWIRARNSDGGKNALRKITRLIKYLRDIKRTFTCQSFLLTTLLGLQMRAGDKEHADFADLPTALKTLFGRLDDWLQRQAFVPHVSNPVLPSENQALAWTEVHYMNVRAQIHRYREWVDDAFDELDAAQSLAKWQRVFGDEFSAMSKAVVAMEGRQSAPALDDVGVARSKGLQALTPAVLMPDWRKPPTWPQSAIQAQVRVVASLVTFDQGRMEVASGDTVEGDQYIRFTCLHGGLAPGPAYRTEWRVTNTGPEATRRRQLRGWFERSDSPHSRQEHLEFRGVHQVEAFLIRESDGTLVGFSKPFYVVIE